MKENSRLKGIKEAQVATIMKLEVALKVVEEEKKEVDESKIKVVALKDVKDF